MKRALRVMLLGPFMVLAAAGMTAVYPIWRSTFWLTDEKPPKKGMVREIWQELVWDLW